MPKLNDRTEKYKYVVNFCVTQQSRIEPCRKINEVQRETSKFNFFHLKQNTVFKGLQLK